MAPRTDRIPAKDAGTLGASLSRLGTQQLALCLGARAEQRGHLSLLSQAPGWGQLEGHFPLRPRIVHVTSTAFVGSASSGGLPAGEATKSSTHRREKRHVQDFTLQGRGSGCFEEGDLVSKNKPTMLELLEFTRDTWKRGTSQALCTQ